MIIFLTKEKIACFVLTTLALMTMIGCFRGRPSEKPPIHLIPDMDDQPKYKAQSSGPIFSDNSAMRTPVPGTIAKGQLQQEDELYTGKYNTGMFVKLSPVNITLPLLQRGQQRYDIYCAPCHSKIGDGQGILIKRGYIPPPSFHSDRIREFNDGYIYDVINNGVRNMPSYGHQIRNMDRWAIVSYVRALQRAQNASLEDIPEQLRQTLKKTESIK